MKRRPFALYLLLVCLVFIGGGGFYGGVAMLADPSGGILGMPTSLLGWLPVHDYLLFGVWLLLVMGIAPFVIAYGLLWRPTWRWADSLVAWSGHEWPWTAALALGLVLMFQLAFQVALFGLIAPIQPITGLFGLGIVALCLAPSVRRWDRRQP